MPFSTDEPNGAEEIVKGQREKEKSPWWDEESNLEGNPRRRGRRYDKWCHEQQKFTDLNPK